MEKLHICPVFVFYSKNSIVISLLNEEDTSVNLTASEAEELLEFVLRQQNLISLKEKELPDDYKTKFYINNRVVRVGPARLVGRINLDDFHNKLFEAIGNAERGFIDSLTDCRSTKAIEEIIKDLGLLE